MEGVPGSVANCLTQMADSASLRGREMCGVIKHGWEIVPIKNVAEGSDEFYMDEEELLKVMIETDGDLLGVYHSHPAGSPHPSDKDETFAYPGYRYFIVTTQALYEWEFNSNGSPDCVYASWAPFTKNMAHQVPNAPKEVR